MLTSAQFDRISTPITDLYEQYNRSVVNDIARRLSKLPMTSTAAWQMQRLTESGKVYEAALEEIARMTGRSQAELKAAFEQAGVQATRFDDKIYRAAGLDPIPLNLSPAMIEVLKVGIQRTDGLMRNLTMTTALSGQQAFESAADLAYLQVTSGAMSYDEAIRGAIKSVASTGLTTIGYANRKDQIDVAVRRALLSGVGSTTGRIGIARAQDMNTDLVQTSAHAGARPEHEVWQGKVFSISGKDAKYPPLVESTGYGEVDGLAGVNCRHSLFPFFEGISKDAYDEATLDEYADKRVTFEGKEMTQYQASQVQRKIERDIRSAKREAFALDAAGKDNDEEFERIKELRELMRGFVRQTGLDRQIVREGGRVLR